MKIKVGVASALITSLQHMIGGGVKTRNQNRCHAHFLRVFDHV